MSLLPIALGATIIGGGLAAAGSISQGNAAYKQGMYNAQVAKQNAAIAEQNAVKVLQEGAVTQQAKRRETAQVKGQQRAMLAALGQVLDIGTAGKILGDTAQLGQTDADTIWRNAQNDALGFRTQGADFRASAEMDVAGAKSARSAGFINAAGTILTTAGNAASMKYTANKMSVPKVK